MKISLSLLQSPGRRVQRRHTLWSEEETTAFVFTAVKLQVLSRWLRLSLLPAILTGNIMVLLLPSRLREVRVVWAAYSGRVEVKTQASLSTNQVPAVSANIVWASLFPLMYVRVTVMLIERNYSLIILTRLEGGLRDDPPRSWNSPPVSLTFLFFVP